MPATGVPPRPIPGYFVASGAFISGAAVFVASQVSLVIMTGGDLSFWGYAILMSIVFGVMAIFGMVVVGLVVFVIVRAGPVPRSSRRQALLVGGLCAGIGVAVVLLVQAATGVMTFFVWSGLIGALAGGIGAARSVWNDRPERVFPDENLLDPKPLF